MWERQYFHGGLFPCTGQNFSSFGDGGLFPYAGHNCSSFGEEKPNSVLHVIVSQTMQVYIFPAIR